MTKTLLVTDCVEKLPQQSEKNRVTLVWAPGHKGIERNEIADRLAREGMENRPTGPNHFCRCILAATNTELKVG